VARTTCYPFDGAPDALHDVEAGADAGTAVLRVRE
jgi:hypothetical protein